MTPADVPTVFIVDDDDFVRAAIRGMLESVGLHRETFGNAARIPALRVVTACYRNKAKSDGVVMPANKQ